MTADEELNLLDDNVRKLKIEYDVYFGGGTKKPPVDTEWRVKALVKKFSDGYGLNYQQRFRYNAIVQKYAVFSDLWRQKMKIKEEGYRRPQDALLAIQGLRTEQEHKAAKALTRRRGEERPFAIECSNPPCEQENVLALFQAMEKARQRSGGNMGSFESFQNFIAAKTEEIRRQHRCRAVEYTVEIEGSQARLKARARK